MRLDEQQAKAVETVGTNILVSASAGAGKKISGAVNCYGKSTETAVSVLFP